jgi:LDH2 family malate/lactate/ureidoglycolate dehydrogenase
MYALPLDGSKRGISHFFMALDISRFSEPALFRRNLQAMVDRVRLLPRLNSGHAVMVSGDPEKKSFFRRSIEGIPIDGIKYAEFLALSPEFESAQAP